MENNNKNSNSIYQEINELIFKSDFKSIDSVIELVIKRNKYSLSILESLLTATFYWREFLKNWATLQKYTEKIASEKGKEVKLHNSMIGLKER